MSTAAEYKPVPVHVARQVGQAYEKSIVLIFCWDEVHQLTHTTTWGNDARNKAVAANAGDKLAKILCGEGFDRRETFEDYRTISAAEQALKVDRLEKSKHELYSALQEAVSLINDYCDGCPPKDRLEKVLDLCYAATNRADEQ